MDHGTDLGKASDRVRNNHCDDIVDTRGKAGILEDGLCLVRIISKKPEDTELGCICQACRQEVDAAVSKCLQDLVESAFFILEENR